MSAVPLISLEIQVKKSTGWEIDARYRCQDYLNCLTDAEKLFDSGYVEAVRVVKETFDAARRVSHEEVVYRSPCRPKRRPLHRGMARSNKSGARNASAMARTTARRKARLQAKPKSKIARFATKFMVVGFISLGGAAFVAYLVLAGFDQLRGMNIKLDNSVSKFVAEFMFVAGFISLFVPLMLRFGPSVRTARRAAGRTAPSGVVDMGRRAMAVAAGVLPHLTAALFEPAGGEAGRREEFKQAYPGRTRTGRGGDDLATDHSEAEPDHAWLEALTEDPAPLPDQADRGEEEPANDHYEEVADHYEEEAEFEDGTPLREEAAGVSIDLLKFIGESLEPLAAAGRQMNAFNRFGLTLYFAGTGEYLASRRQLSEQEIRDILCAHVQMLGHTPELARRFCDNIEEFLVNPKNFKMYEAGRAAVVLRQQDPEGKHGIVEAMEFWNEPVAPTVKHDREFVAVLFTDMVGSTAMTQERGDDAAQFVLHQHDAIVRAELALHGGREIKHTGDGILATFPLIASALTCAIAMQQACERANAADAGLGLGLSIGVNAGEPIHEHGDIFGTPVQLAARVLAKAEIDEIAVSNIVRETCMGKPYRFTKKGDFDLKGFPEPVPIYLLDWRNGAPETAEFDTGESDTGAPDAGESDAGA